jgi:UDP-N-acetylglucosamine 2-epimerase (non-hydrolysing)
MSLVAGARAVVTDSGGIQEETTYLGIPCFTLRDTTERPITVSEGTNRLATAETIVAMLEGSLNGCSLKPARPEYWDGRTAQRCLADLRRRSAR